MCVLDLEPRLAERQLDVPMLDVVQRVAFPAAEVVVGRDVGVELSRSGALDDAEQLRLGQLSERVVDGRPRQLWKVDARPLEHLLGAQVAVFDAREKSIDRAALSGGPQAVCAEQLGQGDVGERGGGRGHLD